MKRSRFVALASALALSTGVAGVAVHGQVAGGSGRPQLGDFGVDLAGMDKSVQPGDDFYSYVNGTWNRNAVIPDDKASFGAFNTLADLSRERTRGILEAEQAKRSKIGTAYATYLDTATIDAKGLAPIQPWLSRVKALGDKGGYAALVAEADRNGVGVPFGVGVGQDAGNPETYLLSVRQSGLGLPDRDYYLSDDPKLVAARTAYQAHLTKLMTLAGEPNADARAKAIVDFETQLAQAHWTRVDSRNATKTYNRMTVAALTQMAPGFDFASYFRGIGAPVTTVNVGQPTAVAGEARLIAAAPLGVLKDQLLVRSLDGFADVLPTPFDQEHFAFEGTVLSGVPKQQDRWKRAVDFTDAALSDDVSRLYVQQYFPPATKAAADQLVRNVIAAMNVRIDNLTWMTPETKVRAHAKLAAFAPKIGYPSRWRSYAALTITPGDAFGNELRARQWQHEYNISHLGKPLQRWEWGMTPMTVNAYANPTMVEIVFPAAILQPPFFDPHADPAVNYGGIGAVIGHEMSHHFDDQGAKFDEHGALKQWWTAQDVSNFNALEDRLVAQYDAYEPLPGMHIKGRLTLGENSADLAGLNAAYDAYHRSLGGRPAPVIDGLTGDQRFYLGWVQVWRTKYRDQALQRQLLTDPHSPGQNRADIVRNMDPWYAAYDQGVTGKIALAPQDRVRIW